MEITISCGTMTHGGAERVITLLANNLASKGHKVELLLYYDKPIFYKLDDRIKVTVDEKIIGTANLLSHMNWRRKYVKQTNPDVVISFLAPFNMVNIVALAGIHVPLIVADRSDPRQVPSNKLIRKARDVLYRFADATVLQSENNKRYFSKAVQEKSEVIPNPVDLGKHGGIGLRTDKKKKIVFVGRLIKQKNPHMLLDAFRSIASDYPDYCLTYYGEGDMRGELIKRIEEYGLPDRVFLPGAVSDIFDSIADAELYVMCSDYEGMPNSLIEAMCLGLAVISTEVSGATDVITNGENGLLTPCNNSAKLAELMRKMLNDDTLRFRCRTNATKLAEKLKVDVICNQWLELIRNTKK